MFLDRSITFSFLIIFHGNSGFNLNPKSYQLIKDPNDNSFSFFGFKVAFQKRSTLAVPDNSNPWLLVGSPRSEIKFLRTSKEPGDVFKCDTGNPRIESCYSIFNDKLLKEIQFEQYSNAWIGAVVETHSYNKEHVILVCGPRYGPDHNPGKQYSVDGICFFLNGTSTSLIAEDPDPWAAPTESSFGWRGRRTLTGNRGSVRFSTQSTARLHPLRPPLPRVVTGSKSIYGLSADFEKVSEGWSALIGLISIHRAAEWEGFVSRVNYSPLKEKEERFKEERRFLRDNKLENKRIKNSYFGSTVIAGKSIDENLIYVSTPRNGSAGKVEVYQKQSNGNTQKPMRFYPGEQTGEVFGASICASDFNNDGFEDIIVGAPFFARSEESFNEGRISVIISNEYDNSFTTSYRYGQRKKSQAQFGLSLSVIGDLNKDGLPDIAVGAPYEDGRGAIYIFLGDKVNGISKRFSQHILASEVDHSLRGFGISMTGEQDVDFNHFDDIGVGSYLSSTVVLIKSKQVIKLRGELKILSGFEREVISVNDEPLLISACVIYEEGQFKTDTAYVQMKIDVDKKNKRTKSVQFNSSLATLNGATIEAVSEISYNTTFCLNFTVQLQEEIKNRDDELLIEMQSYTLNDDERCELKECPMTDPKLYGVLTELRLRFETYFADLQLSSEFINVSGSTFMHTSAKKDLAIKVKLINKKDTAIATNLDIKMTSILSVKYVEGDERCKSFIQLETESGQTRYHCNFRNVKRNEERTIIMHLSTSDLTPEVDELIFNFTVSSSSKESEEDLENNDGSLALSVHVETPLFISGYPNPTEIIISKDEKSDIFKHVYDVCNKSPMKLAVGVNITVPIPVIISAAGRVPMFLLQGKLQLPNEEISCSNDADENLHKFFIEWSDLPDQNFTINVGKELKLKAEKIMKNNFDCNHQTQLFSEGSSIALACVNISCSSYLSEGNATIELRMRSSYRVFEYLIGTDGMRKFITEASVFLSHYREKFHLTGIREANVETKITVDIQENPIWPLVLAIVLTLILLIIITYGLYKANFFKRNRVNKDISNDAAAKSTDNLLTE